MTVFTYAEEVLLPSLTEESILALEDAADREGTGERLAELVRRSGELAGFHFPEEELRQLAGLSVRELDLPDYSEHVLVLSADPLGESHRVYLCGTDRFERTSLFLVREQESSCSYAMLRNGRFEPWEGPNYPGTEENGYVSELCAALAAHRAFVPQAEPASYGEGSRLRRLIRRFHDSTPVTERDAYAALLEELAVCRVIVPVDVTPASVRAALRGPLLGRTQEDRLVSAILVTRECEEDDEAAEDFVAVYSGRQQAESLGSELMSLPLMQVLEAVLREELPCGIAVDFSGESFLLRPEEFGFVQDIETFWEGVFTEEE